MLFLIISISVNYTDVFAYSSNATKQTTLFSNTVEHAKSNTYQDETRYFSISPPQNWSILKNIPASIPNNALVTFSNNNHTGLATLQIYYKSIPKQVISVLDTYSDNDILSEISQELSYNGTDSQTNVLQEGISRYKDGTLVKAVSVTEYQNDPNTIQNEHLIFFLNDGREYTLVLTSKLQDFHQNQIYFETSANTFYVASMENSTQTYNLSPPPVPEFGSLAGMIIVISIIGVVIISRSRFHF